MSRVVIDMQSFMFVKLPVCKINFVVDENTSTLLADKVRQAKKDGLIDQFLYGSVSSGDLVAAIDEV